MKFLILFGVIIISMQVFALEIDEKLTLRIKGISDSRKTILINRGIEDGLAVGDHAKFYVSVGVVSRGVVIKTSPTRSVWALYRLVNKDYIREDQVLKLKITPAVKITKDESKMLVKDDSRTTIAKDPRDIGIPLAEGADDIGSIPMQKGSKMDSFAFDVSSVNLKTKNREVFGMLNYSSYTENTTGSDGVSDFSRDVTNLYFKLGGEWYFKDELKWYSRLSFLAHFALDRKSIMSYEGSNTAENASEFGFGVNYHPKAMPSKIHRFIPYLNFTLALGSINSSFNGGKTTGGTQEVSLDASTFSYSAAFGGKYYTTQGFGARAELSYVLRGDAFADDSSGTTWTQTRSGPRILFGLSYRL